MDEQQRNEVGALVRRARQGRGWKLADLAKAAQVAIGTANNVELGRTVREGSLRAVLNALDIPPLSQTEGLPTDSRVTLAMDLVRKWLEALPSDQVDAAVQDLTRFVVLR